MLSHSFKLSTFLALVSLAFLMLIWARPVAAEDLRTVKLNQFLTKYDSPLAPLAPEFVRVADIYQLDYRLLPAISGVESTFGKAYIAGTYNVYGWGGGELYFKSWSDGITKVCSGLQTNYVNRGAASVQEIGYIYNPVNPVNWAAKVQIFMEQIAATKVTTDNLPAPVGINLSLTI